MGKKPALYVAGLVFALVALAHIWRLATGAVITVDGSAVPTWISVVGLVVSALLSFWMFSSACCCGSKSCSSKGNININGNKPH